MRKRWGRWGAVVMSGAVAWQIAGCAPGWNEQLAVFFRDLAREALAAYLT